MTTATLNFNKTQWNNLFKFTRKEKEGISGRYSIKGIHFTDRYAVATDSHRIVFIADDFGDLKGKSLDKEQNEINADYPNMNSYFNNHFEEYNPNQFIINIAELLQIHKDLLPEAKKDTNKNKPVFMAIYDSENVWFFDREKEIESNMTINIKSKDYYDKRKIAYNCQYMIDLLNLFKSFKYKEIKVSYRQSDRPVEIQSLDGKIKALIMPIRVF